MTSRSDLMDLIFITLRETPGLTVMDLTFARHSIPFSFIFITLRETPGLTVMDLTFARHLIPFSFIPGFAANGLAGWICHGVLNVQSEP